MPPLLNMNDESAVQFSGPSLSRSLLSSPLTTTQVMIPLTPEYTPAPSTANSLRHLGADSTGDPTDEMNSSAAAASRPLVDVPIVVDEVKFTCLVVCHSFFISDNFVGS